MKRTDVKDVTLRWKPGIK